MSGVCHRHHGSVMNAVGLAGTLWVWQGHCGSGRDIVGLAGTLSVYQGFY